MYKGQRKDNASLNNTPELDEMKLIHESKIGPYSAIVITAHFANHSLPSFFLYSTVVSTPFNTKWISRLTSTFRNGNASSKDSGFENLRTSPGWAYFF